MYAKAISEGRSDGALSAEETEALRLALAPPTGGAAGNGSARDRVARPA